MSSSSPQASWRVMLVLGSFVVLVVGLVTLGDWDNAFHLERTQSGVRYRAAGVRQLVLDVHGGGDIHVAAGGTGRWIVVRQHARMFHGTEIRRNRGRAGGTLYVKDGCTGHGFLRRTVCTIDYDLIVPKGVALDLSTISGDITVGGQALHLKASTVAGDVHASGCVVDGDVHSSAGDILVQSACVPQTLFADDGAGDIALRLPRARYALTTDTHFGDVHVAGVIRDPAARRIVRAGTVAGDINVDVLR